MKRLLGLILILGFNAFNSTAQNSVDFNNYTPFKCSGEIPEDFKIELSQYVEDAKSKKAVSRKDKNNEVKFAELSNYQLNNILYSGKVLYGDPMTNYVNKVADVVLKKDPELRSKIRFYVLKNTTVNAYSTQRGIIFINVGLLAQIETEAQLAFILCHEIIHFKNNHNLETYKYNQRLKGQNLDNKLEDMMQYSKENELEADKEGLKLFLTTEYGTKELSNLFDVLLYSYLPFDEIPFDSAYFNNPGTYVIPGKYFPKEVSNITAEEDVSDSMSTHPNIKKRRTIINDLLESKNNPDGLSYIVSKEDFQNVQRMARCELAILHLQETETEDAFYAAYLLEKIYGRTLFGDKIKCGALYIMSKQKSNDLDKFNSSKPVRKGDDEEEDTKEYYKNIEGQSQAVYYFSYKIPSKELGILSAQKNYECYLTYKEDYFAQRFNSLLYDLVNDYDMDLKNFENEVYVKDTSASVEPDTATVEVEKKSKVNKIKKFKAERKEKSKESDNKYYKYAFVGHCKDSMLVDGFEYYISQKEKKDKLDESINYSRYTRAKDKVLNKYGYGLDIHKFVMINPYYAKYILIRTYYNYYYYNYRVKDGNFSPLDEESVELSLTDDFKKYAEKLDIDLSIIGNTQMKNINTDMFNDYQQMLNWFGERLSIGTFGAYTYNDQFMSKYADEYRYMGVCFVSNINKRLEVVFILFDMKTGGSKMLYDKSVRKGKPKGTYSRMMMFDILHQVSQKPKRINKLKKKYHIEEN